MDIKGLVNRYSPCILLLQMVGALRLLFVERKVARLPRVIAPNILEPTILLLWKRGGAFVFIYTHINICHDRERC